MSSRCSYWTGASVPITGERGSSSGRVWRTLGVELSRSQAAALHVAQHRTGRVGRGDRSLAAEPGERERALGVDLGDPRRLDLGALGEVPQAVSGGPG